MVHRAPGRVDGVGGDLDDRLNQKLDHLLLDVALARAARHQLSHAASEGLDVRHTPQASEDLGLVEQQPQSWHVIQAQLVRRGDGRERRERLLAEPRRGQQLGLFLHEFLPISCLRSDSLHVLRESRQCEVPLALLARLHAHAQPPRPLQPSDQLGIVQARGAAARALDEYGGGRE
eukprot:4831961-Prymnesium_polylepis.2